MTQLKTGDTVRNKCNHREFGIVCEVANSGKTVRVHLQPPHNKLWWYDADELEILIERKLYANL